MSRYTPDEREKWLWVDTIDDVAAPSTGELNTAIDLTCDISSVSGFGFSVGSVEVPDMCSRYTSTIEGRASSEDSSIEFYMGDDPTDSEHEIREGLPRGATGHVIRVHPVQGNPAPLTDGTVVEVWPAAVMSNNVNPPAPGEAAKFTLNFAHPSPPEQFAVIGGIS